MKTAMKMDKRKRTKSELDELSQIDILEHRYRFLLAHQMDDDDDRY